MSTEMKAAALVLADGTLFEGEAIGATAPDGVSTGAVSYTHLTLPTIYSV